MSYGNTFNSRVRVTSNVFKTRVTDKLAEYKLVLQYTYTVHSCRDTLCQIVIGKGSTPAIGDDQSRSQGLFI